MIKSVSLPSYFNQHLVQELPVVPGSAYIEAALNFYISHKEHEMDVITVGNIDFDNLCILSDNQKSTFSLFPSETDDTLAIRIAADSGNTTFASMTLSHSTDLPTPSHEFSPSTLQTISNRHLLASEFYETLRERGNGYENYFQSVNQIWIGNKQLLAKISLHSELTPGGRSQSIHSVLLDGCIQALSALEDVNRTFILSSIDHIEFFQKTGETCWAHIASGTSNENDGMNLKGTIRIFTEDNALSMVLHGVQLRYLDAASNKVSPEREIVVAATFTAEPLADSLAFWSKKQELSSQIEFSPYNQLFQQVLTPNSLINSNDSGLNVLLVRPEDWVQDQETIPLQVSTAEKESILSSHKRYSLQAGIEIAHLNQYETEYVYQEIFKDLAYLKHGISIDDGATIIDVGANIGLFTLFVQQQASNTTVYSFEPSPPVFELLSANAKLYGGNVSVFNMGVSDSKKEAEFTFYEKSSVFSSFSADKKADEHAIRAVIENMVRDNDAIDTKQVDLLVDELIADRLRSTNYTCNLLSLSDVIRENQIEQIDLLKLDAEKSELPVLQGILDEDWHKIKQIVMEVHDQEGPLIQEVTEILRSKGFVLEIEEEEFLHNSGLYNIFAKRPTLNGASADIDSKSVERIQIDFASAIKKNASDLIDALEVTTAQRNAPTILALCPPSPTVANDARKMAVLEQAELIIAQGVSDLKNVGYLGSNAVTQIYSIDEYYDADGERLGHIPYTPAYFSALGTAIIRKQAALTRTPYKVIILDCDNTLWQGVCGEDGADGVLLSEPFTKLQSFMRKQVDAGMILCLCSKNVEEDVWAVFDECSDMLLKRTDIVSHRINWQPKSQNIMALAQELQLGLDSFIFLDDNPVECAEVRAACPQVCTLQLPSDPALISTFVDNVWAFDRLTVTDEDKKRTTMYQENLEREQFRTSGITLDGFLKSLNLDIQIQEMAPKNLDRVSQLTYRTNQFNFTTVRRTVGEIQQACSNGELTSLVTAVKDRFGDYGLVGVLFYKTTKTSLEVDTFLLSCRVLGRGVEHAMVAALGRIAQENQLEAVSMPFVPTSKNQPAVDFLNSIAADYKSMSVDSKIVYALPSDVAAAINYKPAMDLEYAESAIQCSSNGKRPKATDESTKLYDSGQKVEQIALKFNSARAILEHMKAEPVIYNRIALDIPYVAPSSELQITVASVWQEILGVSQVGIHDNFFEIGGSSLRGVQLIAQLKRHLNVDLGIVDLFAAPTVMAMTNLIEQRLSGTTVVSAESKSSETRGSTRREKMMARRNR